MRVSACINGAPLFILIKKGDATPFFHVGTSLEAAEKVLEGQRKTDKKAINK